MRSFFSGCLGPSQEEMRMLDFFSEKNCRFPKSCGKKKDYLPNPPQQVGFSGEASLSKLGNMLRILLGGNCGQWQQLNSKITTGWKDMLLLFTTFLGGKFHPWYQKSDPKTIPSREILNPPRSPQAHSRSIKIRSQPKISPSSSGRIFL